MPFQVRPFAEVVETLRATRPDAELHSGEGEHYDTKEAYSFGPIGEWAEEPPISTLYLQKNPLGHSDDVLRDPGALADYANFGGAVATWNAHGYGRWCAAPDQWILLDVELVQEQAEQDPDYFDGDPSARVDVIFALWCVEEGFAAAVWEAGDPETLAKLIGLDGWPSEGWAETKVWYGE